MRGVDVHIISNFKEMVVYGIMWNFRCESSRNLKNLYVPMEIPVM